MKKVIQLCCILQIFLIRNLQAESIQIDSIWAEPDTVVSDQTKPEIADSTETEPKQSFSESFSWAVDILTFGRQGAFANEIGTLNPENRLAKLNAYDGGIYLRPEFKFLTSRFGLWVKPRFNLDIDMDYDTEQFLNSENFDAEFYFQELKFRWNMSKSLYLAGGRYFKPIGTSVFINPSNPFFIDPGRLNPKFEVRPMDFVEFNFSKKAWSFSLIGNLYEADVPIYQEPFFDFERKYAFQAEYYGTSDNLGAIVSVDEKKRVHFGYYGQKNLNEAIVAWVDGSVEYKPNRFYPVAGHSTELIAFDMIDEDLNEKVFPTVLAGASYTFGFGPTLQVEYYFNGKGYTDKEFDLYQEMVASSVNYNFDITRVLSDRNLGRGINTGMPYIRRHYLFSQLGQNDVWGQLNLNARYFYSFDDESSQVSSLIEWNVADRLEIHSVFLMNFGGRNTDFNRLLDHQIMLGLLLKI